MFFKIGVLGVPYCKTPVLKSFFSRAEEEAPTLLFSCDNREIFKNSFLYRTPLVAAFASLINKLTVQYWESADLLLLNRNTIWAVFINKACGSEQSIFFTYN